MLFRSGSAFGNVDVGHMTAGGRGGVKILSKNRSITFEVARHHRRTGN